MKVVGPGVLPNVVPKRNTPAGVGGLLSDAMQARGESGEPSDEAVLEAAKAASTALGYDLRQVCLFWTSLDTHIPPL